MVGKVCTLPEMRLDEADAVTGISFPGAGKDEDEEDEGDVMGREGEEDDGIAGACARAGAAGLVDDDPDADGVSRVPYFREK